MFSSEAISRDMSRNSSYLLPNPSNDGGFKSRDSMGSDLFLNQQQSNQQGLARYRSAPSSLLAALLDSTTENSSSGDESEALLSALMDGPRDLNQIQKGGNPMHYHLKQEVGAESEPRPGHMGYESAVSGGGGAIVGSYSVGMENHVNLRSNLVRQSSSPAGFFNGYGIMGEVEDYRVQNHSKASSSAAGGLSSHISFSSSRFMPSIPENVNESIANATRNPENGQLGSANAREFDALFPQDSWNDTPFSSLKRNRDHMFSNFNGLESQSGETRRSPHGLVHHLSLPKTATEMAELDKFLQAQPDTTPCQIRAKRGCATHPRSIAERVRRTRISEKMKKLQDLFPNMDKQTSTADMLDLAVQYIKDLQVQVETLTEMKAKCVCSIKSQQTGPRS
ncbi:transcription factor bHLH130-like [Salvia miltiorrhiza]|uniref:transcription factor bHLH130-like n=1 Tax=Salvia miltiorrhiza TaxID=226208 RepID=UPI0025ABDF26|nr:transcription factor bHLH130-like [Salvia miltiorrhiza]